jgi:hypothetical protein
VDLSFGNAGLAALCNSEQHMVKRWGRDGFTQVGRRLLELSAVRDPSEIELLPYVAVERDASGTVAIDFDRGDVVIEGLLTELTNQHDGATGESTFCVTSVTVRARSSVT